jgi:hypothetical protein
MHERIAEDKFAAYELSDSEDFDNRQKARNILRYQLRQYCFELPPTCARWGKMCFTCPHVKCRENENYDGEKCDYDFDPDIDRFASLFDNLQEMATVSYKSLLDGTAGNTATTPQPIDIGRSMDSLLTALAEKAKQHLSDSVSELMAIEPSIN